MHHMGKLTYPQLAEMAHRNLPGGGFGNHSPEVIIREGRAAHVWDVQGRELIDYLLGSGPMLIGHAHPEVVSALQEQVGRGTTFFANNEPGILLAEEIVSAVACADQIRFTSSGTEATLYAMRLARAHRGREKILKFEGGFHGMNDYALISMAPKQSTNFPQGIPDSPGIPLSVSREVLIAPFNDIDAAIGLIDEHHDELGGVIVEPFQRLLPPKPGFLEALREATARYDVPLIFDEIVTGFRFAYGGAQEYYGVVPDLCTLGKVIGGGFPLAAVAGRRDIMQLFDQKAEHAKAFLPHIGTLNGNAIAAVAGLATLEVLRRPGTYAQLFGIGRKLRLALRDLLKNAGLPAFVIGDDPLFDVVFGPDEPSNYRGMLRCDAARLERFNTLLFQHGILKGDTKFYISIAHTHDDVDTTIAAFKEVIAGL